MPIEYQQLIRRSDLVANRDKTYIFGDNFAEVGYGGQAAEMRGEPNAYGIPTKWDPGRCFTDADYVEVVTAWHLDFIHLSSLVLEYKRTLVIPKDGIGTGLAALPSTAPRLYRRLTMFFNALEMDARHANNN